MKRKKRLILVMLVIIVGSALGSITASDQAFAASKAKPGKVNYKTIKQTDSDRDLISFKWIRPKNAKHYKIAYRAKGTTKWKYTKDYNPYKHAYSFIDGLEAGTKYQLKIRAYNGKRAGKWSKIVVMKTKPARKPSYTYDVKFFNQPYSDRVWGVYIETNNPDPDNFSLDYYNSKGKDVSNVSMFCDYFDLPLTEKEIEEEYTPWRYTVPGGYVEGTGGSEAGELTVKITEAESGFDVGDVYYGKCDSSTITVGKISVLDYNTERTKWMKQLISDLTTEDMTPKEKMTTITKYLQNTTKYYKTYACEYDDWDYLSLIVDAGVPQWISGEWDSCDSPAALEDIGKLIGYPVHNMYYDYSYGSEEWSKYHWYAKSLEDGSMYAFCNKQPSNFFENIHTRDDVEKVNCQTYERFITCH